MKMRITHVVSMLLVSSSCSAPVEPVAGQTDLQRRAEQQCRASRPAGAALPPKPFTTDGCSMWPDSDWGHCCIEHDIEYWCGGSGEQRAASDRRLRQCLSDSGHPAMGVVMQLGTRTGGVAVLPLPWRWGYGWPWPGAGDPPE